MPNEFNGASVDFLSFMALFFIGLVLLVSNFVFLWGFPVCIWIVF